MVISCRILSGAVSAQAPPQTRIDCDVDDNGLIEIETLEQLSAVRFDRDGDGMPSSTPTYAATFPDAADNMGCSGDCRGYELNNDLDFDDANSYASGAANKDWSKGEGGSGWAPIAPHVLFGFAATFNGNGRAICNLYIDGQAGEWGQGLFGIADDRGIISNVGVTGSVTGDGKINIGGLVGYLDGGTAERSYSAVAAKGDTWVGSLAGRSDGGTVRASYASGTAVANDEAGGLIGSFVGNGGRAEHAYASGYVTVTASSGGGLVGYFQEAEIKYAYATALIRPASAQRGGVAGENHTVIQGMFAQVYWDTEASGIGVAVGSGDSGSAMARTTAELQAPQGYVGICARWNEGGAGDYWDFGTAAQYPALKTGFNGDGMPSWQEFGFQLREGPRDTTITYADHANVLRWVLWQRHTP